MSPEACAKKRSREPTAVPCECERPNAGDVYSPWGDVTPVTEGNEAGRPELAQKKWSRKPSAVPCECERRNVGDVYSSWGEVTSVTDGREAGRPELAQKVVEGAYCRSVIVRAKGLEPIRTKAPDPKSGLATNYNTLAKPFGRLITLSPSLKSAFWKLPTSVSERSTKLCIFFKYPKQPASGHSQKQSLT